LPEAPIANPPPRQIEPEAKPPVHANPPPRQIEPPVPALPMPTNPAAVEKRADGTCVEVHHVTCPPNVRCNPPPPSPVQCPPGK
jgi:hypothetical protein